MPLLEARWPAPVLALCNALITKGFTAYVVGGAVRDAAMGRTPKDYDIATSATPEEVTAYFDQVIPTGLKFGTVTVISDGLEMEVTTYRADGRYEDGRRPTEVHYADSIEEDLSRRDFTVNAMAVNPLTDRLIDPYDGMGDIKAKLIRAVGDAVKRFTEDGLRPLRACRFVSTLGFDLNAMTLASVESCLPTFRNVAAERKWQELRKLLTGEAAWRAVYCLDETGLLNEMLPELTACKGIEQNRYHTRDVYEHSLGALRQLCEPTDPILALAALVHDIGKPDSQTPHPDRPGEYQFLGHEFLSAQMCENIALRFSMSMVERERLVTLVGNHMLLMHEPETDAGCRRLLRKLEPAMLNAHCELRWADVRSDPGVAADQGKCLQANRFITRLQRIASEVPPLTVKALAVSGRDVMDIFGCKPGPAVGQTLNTLLDLVLEDPSRNTHEQLIAELMKMTYVRAEDATAQV